jgi:tRNA(fMet)-specific endonuclease VapC
MKYLLDTCTISNFIKGHPSIIRKLKSHSPNLLCFPSISLMEIEYGLKLNLERAEKINSVIEALLSHIHIFSFEERDSKIAGTIRADLKKSGTPIPMQIHFAEILSNSFAFSKFF